ncbi:MAG: hypothetical protein PHS95_03220 [Candidatus Pacebacteria bacterium]|nr:hypothetical protein [Candidatus Paceibacterota bacterium]
MKTKSIRLWAILVITVIIGTLSFVLVPSAASAENYGGLPAGCTSIYNYSPTGQPCDTPLPTTYQPRYSRPSRERYWRPEITSTETIGCSSVTLNGTVYYDGDRVTSGRFEVATSENNVYNGPRTYTNQENLSRSGRSWNATISRLVPGVRYYYRPVVSTWNGELAYGTVTSFVFDPPRSCYNNYQFREDRDRMMPFQMMHRPYYQYDRQYYQRGY